MKEQVLVYLASPYEHEDEEVMFSRFDEISKITEQILIEVPGIVPFSPIAYTYQYRHLDDFDWLDRMDFCFLSACDAMLFVQMDGWGESDGMVREKRFCREQEIPVFHTMPNDVLHKCQVMWEQRKRWCKNA